MTTYEVRNEKLNTLNRTSDMYEALGWYTSLEHGHLAVLENNEETILFAK